MSGLNKIYLVLLLCLLGCATSPVENSTGKNASDSLLVKNHASRKELILSQFSFESIEGVKMGSPALSGKTVFVNIWATWCKPCVEEMPSLEALADSLRNENIIFVIASPENRDEVLSFRQEYTGKLELSTINNFDGLGVEALPASFIFDKSGKLQFSCIGSREWNSDEHINLVKSFIQ